MNKTTKWITRTALLLAMCLLFQSLRMIPVFDTPYGQYFIGSLVNLTLIIAAWSTGLFSGVIISLLAPVIASIQGFTPFIQIVPLIALGNIVIVFVTWLFREKYNFLGVILGAVAKFLALWLAIVKFLLPLMVDQNIIVIAKANKIAPSFSFPQLITALVGGVIALLIWPRIKKVIQK